MLHVAHLGGLPAEELLLLSPAGLALAPLVVARLRTSPVGRLIPGRRGERRTSSGSAATQRRDPGS